jgi:hypothetical protein
MGYLSKGRTLTPKKQDRGRIEIGQEWDISQKTG